MFKPMFRYRPANLMVPIRFGSTRSRNIKLRSQVSEQELPQRPSDNIASQSDTYQKRIVSRIKPITPHDSFVSYTNLDSKGNVTAVSKRYPKMNFLKENHLFPRDLRKIDSSSIDVVPLIMIKPSNAIIVNLLHIKAIIKKDCIKVFDTTNPDIAAKLGLFMYDLEMKLKLPSTAPYEFRVLETIFVSVMGYLEAELKSHMLSCGLILSELEDEIDRYKLQDLLIKLKKLSSFYQKAVLIRDVLDEILENDEDLAGMYLSEPVKFTDEGPYDEVEMILESYYNHCDEFVQQAGSLINDIKATEEIVNIILDANRNALMLYELKITIYTLGVTVATLLPAFYGMNLKNYIEESNYGFAGVLIVSLIQGLLFTAFNFRRLRGVQKVNMMSNANTPSAVRDVRKATPHSGNKMLNYSKRNWNRLLYGRKKYDRPTSKERDVIWRMINDKTSR